MKLDTELVESLCEDLAAAGVSNRREAFASSEYRFQPPPRKPSMQIEELDPTAKLMEVNSAGIHPMQIGDRTFEPELPNSECSIYGHQPGHEMQLLPPFQVQYSSSNTPLIKVSQQIEEYESHPTATSDASYPGDDDGEGFSTFEESIIIPDLPSSQVDPVFPQFRQQSKSFIRHSLGFRDDELLAEQVSLAFLLVVTRAYKS